MSNRHLPVRPNLDQLKHQAKELLRAIHVGEASALEELRQFHPETLEPAATKLADAQLVLARSYDCSSWPRLVIACKMTDAIWRGDVIAIRALIRKDPNLIHQTARGVPDGNWSFPMSYAATVGQVGVIQLLRDLGADDTQHAFDRACLKGNLDAARVLFSMGAHPIPGCVMGPCETLNPSGLKFLLDLGAELCDEHGDRLAPVAMILEIYGRNREGRQGCMDLVEQHGVVLPDTPPMAVMRGRIDLLEKHLARDPELFTRTFSHEEIYPPSLGCHEDHTLAMHGTPIADSTLLHICVDFDEIEIARWMLDHGADVNAKAKVDAEGFGGHTALFGCVVSQPYSVKRQTDGAFTRLLLEHGAEPNVRASLRKQLRWVDDETLHEYHDLTPLEWGRQFHDRGWVNPVAVKLITEAGGT